MGKKYYARMDLILDFMWRLVITVIAGAVVGVQAMSG